MVTGLISVGLFWGILFYYIRQTQRGFNATPLLKSILPNEQKFKRYWTKCKKFIKRQKYTDQEELQVQKIQQGFKQQSEIYEGKLILQKNNQVPPDLGSGKTKSIMKQKRVKKPNIKDFRSWLLKTNNLKNISQVDRKNISSSNQQNSQKTLLNQKNLLQLDSPVLEQIVQQQSPEDINNENQVNTNNTKNKIQIYDPFGVNEQNI